MRLIDADAMMLDETLDFCDTSKLKEMLDHQPTAFDLEKVIQQLEDKELEHLINGLPESTEMYDEKEGAIAQGFEEAIEIVKSGGIDGKNGG